MPGFSLREWVKKARDRCTDYSGCHGCPLSFDRHACNLDDLERELKYDVQVLEGPAGWTIKAHVDKPGSLVVCVENEAATGANGKVVVEDGYSRADDGPGWVTAYRVEDQS